MSKKNYGLVLTCSDEQINGDFSNLKAARRALRDYRGGGWCELFPDCATAPAAYIGRWVYGPGYWVLVED